MDALEEKAFLNNEHNNTSGKDKSDEFEDEVIMVEMKKGEVKIDFGDEDNQNSIISSADNSSNSNGCKKILRDNILLILSFAGVALGFLVGFSLRSVKLTPSAIMWLGLPGDVFMRAINLTILPLIVASVISGTASLDPKLNGKITTVALIYIMIANTGGTLIGIVMYYVISPVKYFNQQTAIVSKSSGSVRLKTEDIFADLIRNMFPNNVVTACFTKTQTSYEEISAEQKNDNSTGMEFSRHVGTASGTNVLGILVVCMAVGIATGRLREKGIPVMNFFKSMSDIVIEVMHWVIWLTPIGVLSLIATSIAKTNNISGMFKSFGMFALAVMLAVLLICVIICLTYFFLMRKNPLMFLYSGLRAMLAGFAPPSSVMAIPDLLTAAETVHKVDTRLSCFMVLFSAATCRCGSAAFVVICSLFLASLEGVNLQAGQVVCVAILIIFSMLALPSVPSGSVVCTIIILSSVNVSTTNIGVVMVLEWILDRCRTATNVLGMLFGVIVIDKFCKADNNIKQQK